MGEIDQIVEQYKANLLWRKGLHLYDDGKTRFLASFENIEANGILILKTVSGAKRKFAFKEVQFIIAQ